jgi:hypothetical protein
MNIKKIPEEMIIPYVSIRLQDLMINGGGRQLFGVKAGDVEMSGAGVTGL